jgi:hypothetical protein
MSHFSTLKTELRDRQALLLALADLGHTPAEGSLPVRGYRGQTVTAELAVSQEGGADIGFRWSAEAGSYELVTDLERHDLFGRGAVPGVDRARRGA